MGKKTD